MTPFQVLFQKPPSYSHLKVIGRLCYASTLDRGWDKFSPRAIKCALLGYPPDCKGYKLIDLDSMQEIITRNVTFHEDVFPFSHLSPSVFPSSSQTPHIPSTSNTDLITPSPHPITPSPNKTTISSHGRTIKPPSHLSDFICNSVASATPYPISSYFSLSKLSPKYLKYVILMSAIFEPATYNQASQHEEWQQALQDELAAFSRTYTWYVTILHPGKVPIDCKWEYKVRLVAKGFTQLEGVDFLDTFSPVAKLSTMKMLLALVAIKGWSLSHLDINNDFHYGDLEEDIYMTLPPGYDVDWQFVEGENSDSTLVCKLKKSLYGLKQASRQWYLKLSEVLKGSGLQQSASDHLFFFKNDNNGFFGIVV